MTARRDSVPGVEDTLRRSLDETLLWLCAIASPIGEERALCDALHKRMGALALSSPIRRYLDSIVVPLTRVPGTKSGRPHIVLCGHTDTVRTENGPARIEGNRIFGSGASDMKSGLALMVALAEHRLEALSHCCDVTLVFYAREEGPFAENELGPVLDGDADLATADLAICLEPSNNKLHLGCMGSVHAQVTFHGRTAHSARPWQGESAVSKAWPFIKEVAELAPDESTLDGLHYRSVTTITQAKDGGRGRNVVPDTFLCNVNHRFAPDRTLEDAQRHIMKLVSNRAELVFTDLSPAAPPRRDHRLVEQLVAAGVRAVEPKHAWTDVARFAARGIAAVNFGPGENAQAHQKNESTDLPLVHEGFEILERFLRSAK